MSKRRVLYVVEGERADPRFLIKMHQIYFNTKPENIFSYRTCIHQLLESMCVKGKFDENLDLVSVLRETANNRELEVLDYEFSQVYLIFDMDPQDKNYNPSLMYKAMNFFSDPSDHGKLYLNYPMLESYRHVRCIDDESYLHSMVDTDSIKRYKELVDSVCPSELKCLPSYTREIFDSLIHLNLRKAALIVKDTECVESSNEYSEIHNYEILEKQIVVLMERGALYILNTSLFLPIDLSPDLFFQNRADSDLS